MRRLWFITLLFTLLLLLAACVGHNPPPARGATPEEAASNVIPKFHGSPTSFALHGTHVTPYGTAVFYTKSLPENPNLQPLDLCLPNGEDVTGSRGIFKKHILHNANSFPNLCS